MWSIGKSFQGKKLLAGLTATINSVFPSVYVMNVPGTYNSMIYATVQPTRWQNLDENLAILMQTDNPDPTLIQSIRITLENLRPVPQGGLIFTDDKAPIEQITNQMVLNNILSDPILMGENK